jgi:hypothetical protein
MAIKAMADTGQPVSPGDWAEVDAILTRSLKVREYPKWIDEERQQGLALGPEDFWVSLSEPAVGGWLATTEGRRAWRDALEAASKPPAIDPGFVVQDDFGVHSGAKQLSIYGQRGATGCKPNSKSSNTSMIWKASIAC